MSDEMKPKKRAAPRRRMAAASSPAPADIGPVCGHSNCDGGVCNVRYVGPTTLIRDHHAMHAARGVSHVWTAAIVSGLAVVITGAIAWSSADAAMRPGMGSEATQRASTDQILKRLDDVERLLRDTRSACASTSSTRPGLPPGTNKPEKRPATSTTSGDNS